MEETVRRGRRTYQKKYGRSYGQQKESMGFPPDILGDVVRMAPGWMVTDGCTFHLGICAVFRRFCANHSRGVAVVWDVMENADQSCGNRSLHWFIRICRLWRHL